MLPFSRSWSTAQTSTPLSSTTFSDLLSHPPPLPSRTIVAAALFPAPDTYLPSIIQAHPTLSDWPAVIAASVYPSSFLPPDHHSLDPLLTSLTSTTLSPAALPKNSTTHSPLEYTALGLHYPHPPTSTPQSLSPIPTLSHYSLPHGISPSLDYSLELGLKTPQKPSQKSKVVLLQKHAPSSSKTPSSVFRVPKHVHATIKLGRKRNALGSPALNRRDKPVDKTTSTSPVIPVPLSKPVLRSVPRSVPSSNPPRPSEVIALDDDDHFSLAQPHQHQQRTESLPSSQHAERAPTVARTEGGDVVLVEDEERQAPTRSREQQSQPTVRRRAPTAEERAALIDVDAIIGDIGDRYILGATDAAAENGDRVDAGVDVSAGNGALDGSAPGQGRRGDQDQDDDEDMTLGWKKKPDMKMVFNALDSVQDRTQMRREKLQKLDESDTVKLLVRDSAHLKTKRNETLERRKKQALAAKEKHRLAAIKQLEKKKKLVRRKRRAAAKARGEVYESDSEEENTDPAEPEDNDAEQDSVQNHDTEQGDDEIIHVETRMNPKSGVRARSPPGNMYSQLPVKRQRSDYPDDRHREQHPYQNISDASPQSRVYGQHSVNNRGLPPPQHPFNGGHLHGAPSQGLPPPPYRGNEYPPQPYPSNGQYMANGQYPPPRPFPPPHAPYQPPPPVGNYAPRSSGYNSASLMNRTQNHESGHRFTTSPLQDSQYSNSYPPQEHGPPYPYYGTSPPPQDARPHYPQHVFEQKRKQLYDQIQSMMADLTPEDRTAIDAFLDNQRNMFLPGEETKEYRLQLRNRVLTKLRINKSDGTWSIIRVRM